MTASIDLRPGSRLRSAVCTGEIVVVRAPTAGGPLCCGGAPMHPLDDATTGAALDPAWAGGTLIGKRYVDVETDFEVLCTKAGTGSLSIDGRPLTLKDAKPLPSSD